MKKICGLMMVVFVASCCGMKHDGEKQIAKKSGMHRIVPAGNRKYIKDQDQASQVEQVRADDQASRVNNNAPKVQITDDFSYNQHENAPAIKANILNSGAQDYKHPNPRY